jgi:hypothetical protein
MIQCIIEKTGMLINVVAVDLETSTQVLEKEIDVYHLSSFEIEQALSMVLNDIHNIDSHVDITILQHDPKHFSQEINFNCHLIK